MALGSGAASFSGAMEKDDVMIFEQPAKLSRFLHGTASEGKMPLRFWRWANQLGLIVLAVFGLSEWRRIHGQPILPEFLRQERSEIWFVLYLLLYSCGSRWLEGRCKRKLSISDDGLKFGFLFGEKIAWNRIQSFRIEPCGPQGEFEKLTVRYTHPYAWKPNLWMMVFADAASCTPLLDELERRQKRDGQKFTIEIGETATHPRAVSVASMWLASLGILSFLYGLPLFLTGISLGYPRASEEARLERLSPPLAAVWKWTGSDANPHLFVLLTGIVLTSAGIGVFWRGRVLAREKS